MPSYLLILICSVSFGLCGLLFGYYRGISKGMRKRSRLTIISNFPNMSMREVLN
jgi:hypothetical protein